MPLPRPNPPPGSVLPPLEGNISPPLPAPQSLHLEVETVSGSLKKKSWRRSNEQNPH